MIEFTNEELKRLGLFDPEVSRAYLNDLLTQKITLVAEKIEKHWRQTYCKHGEAFHNSQLDRFECDECRKIWILGE